MKYPKITIITISYNSALTIRKTIESIINQSYKNKEYIIIDGNSSDGTQNIVNEYKEQIDIFISEKDKGISDAFNKGITYATGDLIVCINSNDYLLPNSLNEVAKQYEEQIDLFCGNLLLWDPNTNYRCVIQPSLNFPKMPFLCKPNHQGLFVKKSLYERIGGYDINLHWAMDLDFLMRATRNKAQFKHINTNIAVFRLGGITDDSVFKKKKEYIYIIRKNGGNIFQAYIFYCFMAVTQTIKKTLELSGFDIIRRLRYKKENI